MDKIKIDTLIMSDFHLGDNSTRCDEILKVLRKYEYKQLILNGDILNGLHFKRLHTDHWKILSKLRSLTKHCKVIWVHGNHDANSFILSRLLGIKVFNKYIWESDNKKFLAIHGHQYDRFLKKNFLVSYIFYALYKAIRVIDQSGFLSGLIKKYSATWRRGSLEVARGALRYARLLNADYVFCGHTHKIYKEEKKGIKYYNTASWNDKPSGYITILNGEVRLEKIN